MTSRLRPTGDVLSVITALGDVNRQRQAIENAALVEAIVEYSTMASVPARHKHVAVPADRI